MSFRAGFSKTANSKAELRDLIKEHKKLIPLLEHGSQKARMKEGKDQAKEEKGYERALAKEGSDKLRQMMLAKQWRGFGHQGRNTDPKIKRMVQRQINSLEDRLYKPSLLERTSKHMKSFFTEMRKSRALERARTSKPGNA